MLTIMLQTVLWLSPLILPTVASLCISRMEKELPPISSCENTDQFCSLGGSMKLQKKNESMCNSFKTNFITSIQHV